MINCLLLIISKFKKKKIIFSKGKFIYVKGRGSNPLFSSELRIKNQTTMREKQNYEIEFNYLINRGNCDSNQTFFEIFLDKANNFKQVIFISNENETDHKYETNKWINKKICVNSEPDKFNVKEKILSVF
jgi:hypothetical protein